jgi:hypothetical protein
MEKNNCELCSKQFNSNYHFTRHLQRLTPCNKSSSSVNIDGNKNTVIIGNYNVQGNNNKVSFIINKYGEENIEYLTEKSKEHIIKKCFKSIIALIEKKHFNHETPENCNLYTSNFNNGISHYYNGIKWISTKNKELIQELHDQNLEEVIEMFQELKELGKLDETTIKRFEYFIEEKNTDNNEKTRLHDIKLLLYNKREDVIKIVKMMKTS